MKNMSRLAAFWGLAFMVGHAQAQSQFDFTLTGYAYTFNGTSQVPYGPQETISGIITLNASQTAATSLFVTSTPSPSSEIPNSYNWVIDASDYGANAFSVSGGNISSVSFGAADFTFGDIPQIAFASSNFSYWDGVNDVENYTSGYSAITFTPVVTPEPATLALTGLGIAGMIAARRRK